MNRHVGYVFSTMLLASFALQTGSSHSQDAGAFGASPAAALYSTIRQLSASEARKINADRVCQKSVPLIGGREVVESSLEDLKNSRDKLASWERDFQQRNVFALSDGNSLSTDKGKHKYFLARKDGVDFKDIDLFISTFITRKLLQDNKYSEVLEETNRLITTYDLKPNFHQVNQAEQATYLTKDTMANITNSTTTWRKIGLRTMIPQDFIG
jgi:hypothetical protein